MHSPRLRSLKPQARYYGRIITMITMCATIAILSVYIVGCTNGPTGPTGPATITDISTNDISVKIYYNTPMRINLAYKVTVSLTSNNNNLPLSSMKASLAGQQDDSLQNILGPKNTGCVAVYLNADDQSFSVSSSPYQEVPLNQSSLRWQWSVTPLHGGKQTIPVDVVFTGKVHCGDATILAGPYYLSNPPEMTIQVNAPNNTSPPVNVVVTNANSGFIGDLTSNPTFVAIVNFILGLLAGLIIWFARSSWEKRRKKKEADEVKREALKEAEKIKQQAFDDAEKVKQAAKKIKQRVERARQEAEESRRVAKQLANDAEVFRQKTLDDAKAMKQEALKEARVIKQQALDDARSGKVIAEDF